MVPCRCGDVSAAGGRRQQPPRLSSGNGTYCAGGAPLPALLRSIGACLGLGAWAGRFDGVRAGAEPVVSGCAAGSAVMMLTGGIESDDGKNSSGPFEPGGRGDARADAPAGNPAGIGALGVGVVA